MLHKCVDMNELGIIYLNLMYVTGCTTDLQIHQQHYFIFEEANHIANTVMQNIIQRWPQLIR